MVGFDLPGRRTHHFGMIQPGARLPLNLVLKVLQDNEEKEVELRHLLTRRTVVSVYMRNNTGGCDKQNDSLVGYAAELDRAGFNLIALSRDALASHRKYAAKKGIAYALASDPEDRFARATDSLIEKSMYGRKFIGPARSAYVLDCDGTALAVIPKVNPADHAAQIRAVIAQL